MQYMSNKLHIFQYVHLLFKTLCLQHISNIKLWQEDEEEDFNSYWMTLRKREDIANLKRKYWNEICGELTLEGRQQNEWLKYVQESLFLMIK